MNMYKIGEEITFDITNNDGTGLIFTGVVVFSTDTAYAVKTTQEGFEGRMYLYKKIGDKVIRVGDLPSEGQLKRHYNHSCKQWLEHMRVRYFMGLNTLRKNGGMSDEELAATIALWPREEAIQ